MIGSMALTVFTATGLAATIAAGMMADIEGVTEGADNDGLINDNGLLTATNGELTGRPAFKVGRPIDGTNDTEPAREAATWA